MSATPWMNLAKSVYRVLVDIWYGIKDVVLSPAFWLVLSVVPLALIAAGVW